MIRVNEQKPIASGFGPASTAADVINGIGLSDKVAIVTGGYSGIGLETVRALRTAGADVIVPARDKARATSALVGISGVEVAEMDLLNPVSIDAFAVRFLATRRPVHILINSAGIMGCPLARDARGYESQFATNHLGHFQLVKGLWPALKKAQGARVISVSSRAHHRTPMLFKDPNFERTEYDPILAYGQSKTANVLFAVALDRRGAADGVQAFSLHPGAIVDTRLGRHMSKDGLRKSGYVDEHGKAIINPFRDMKTIEQGAATSVWCATSPRLDGFGGTYCQDCDIAPLAPQQAALSNSTSRPPDSIPSGVMPYAIDPAAAEQLWALSERLLAAQS